MVAALVTWHGWLGNKPVKVPIDHHSLENWATENLKTVRGRSKAKHVGMSCFLNLTSMGHTPLPCLHVGFQLQ